MPTVKKIKPIKKRRILSKKMNSKPSILMKKAEQKDVLTLALERMRYIYHTFDFVGVSCSGGKDSSIVVNLALEIAREQKRLPVHVYFVDEEVIPPEVDEYMLRLRENPDVDLKWVCVPLVYYTNSESQDRWFTWDEQFKHLWLKPKSQFAITEVDGYDPEKSMMGASQVTSLLMRNEKGRIANCVGVRATESLSRYRSVSRKEHENFLNRTTYGDGLGNLAVKNKNFWKAYPIYDWGDMDVWTAFASKGYDYCRAYDKMAMAGLSMHEQRIGPPFGSFSARSLWTWSECWPEYWDRVADRVAGVRTSSMYSKSAIYGKGQSNNIRKPADMTWEQYLQKVLAKIKDAPLRNLLSGMVNRYILSHYRCTRGAPIAVYVQHPDSGVSWSHLIRIVMRKDKDSREMPSLYVVPKRDFKKYQEAMQRYTNALKEEELL